METFLRELPEISADSQERVINNNFHAFFVQQPQPKNLSFFERRLAGLDGTIDVIVGQIVSHLCISAFMWTLNKVTQTQTPEELQAKAITQQLSLCEEQLKAIKLDNKKEQLNLAKETVALLNTCDDEKIKELLKQRLFDDAINAAAA